MSGLTKALHSLLENYDQIYTHSNTFRDYIWTVIWEIVSRFSKTGCLVISWQIKQIKYTILQKVFTHPSKWLNSGVSITSMDTGLSLGMQTTSTNICERKSHPGAGEFHRDTVTGCYQCNKSSREPSQRSVSCCSCKDWTHIY